VVGLSAQELPQPLRVIEVVVHTIEQHVGEGHGATAVGLREVAAGLHQGRQRPARYAWHQLPALLVGAGVERDGQLSGQPLLGVTVNAWHDAGGGDGDPPRRDAKASLLHSRRMARTTLA